MNACFSDPHLRKGPSCTTNPTISIDCYLVRYLVALSAIFPVLLINDRSAGLCSHVPTPTPVLLFHAHTLSRQRGVRGLKMGFW